MKEKPATKRTRAKQRAGSEDGLRNANEAFQTANRAFDTLLDLASGEPVENHYAASCLVHLLTRIVGNFQCLVDEVQRRQKEIPLTNKEIAETLGQGRPPRMPQLDFAAFAREKDCWPILYHAHRERRRRTEELIKRLELGKGTGLQFDGEGKPWSYFTPANNIVLRLRDYIASCSGNPPCGMLVHSFDGERKLAAEDQERFTAWIREHASGIPPLSLAPEVLKRWTEAGRALLPIMFGDEYQTHREFSSWAKNAEHTKTGKPARWSQRKRIQEALADAWKSVAADNVGGE